MIEACVIGWPISHSRSPLIHGFWLNKYKIEGLYTKQAVAPDALDAFIQGLRDGPFVGSNVTLPHKEAAVVCVDEPDDRVRRIGALNTIWRNGTRLFATSTDGQGFLANIRHTLPAFEIARAPVTILGAGGSTRAITDELLRADVDCIFIYNRTETRAQALARHFGPKVRAVSAADLGHALGATALLVNTTSAGMTGGDALSLPWADLASTAVVADIVYTPLITPILATAQSRGHAVVPGLGMLLHQAVVGFEKWFGLRPEVTKELHDLVAKDIDPDFMP
jgi:shikimate dehydrogenase